MSCSPPLRGRISCPLEAGPALAYSDQLPSPVDEALHYVSKRLGRKAPHITLLVVRRDYQLPTSPVASPSFTPSPHAISPGSALLRSNLPAPSRLEALKQLVRPGNSGEAIRERIVHVHLDHFRNGTASPAFSEASAVSASTASSKSTADSAFSRRARWPGSPAAYGSVPVTPATPFTVMSSLSGADGNSGAPTAAQFGMKLVYAHPPGPREEKNLHQALEKAAKKYKLDPTWLPSPVSSAALGLPVDLVLRSTAQNEALFSSDRLTLLSLDHLYTFRAALQAYARAKAARRLEDAVDELRRLFLASGRRALRKSALLAAYRWLDPVSDAALADVCRMYERAYGGTEKESGVDNDVDPAPAWPLSERGRGSVGTKPAVSAPRAQRPAARPPPPRREPHSESPVRNIVDAMDKETLISAADTLSDDQSELDEIEAWYREVETENNAPVVEIHPLRSHPAAATPPAVAEIPAPPPTPPPPPPTSATYRGRPWHQPAEPDLDEMRRTTPKLRPAPPGRSLALKLQTTFDKPVGGASGNSSSSSSSNGGKQPASLPLHRQAEQNQRPSQADRKGEENEDGDDGRNEDEDLTARPHSAIRSFANACWTAGAGAAGLDMGNGVSIDEMLHGGRRQAHLQHQGFHHGDSDEAGVAENSEPQDQQQYLQSPQAEERVGPMTPNGYDDISPITRGEWKFLMFGKGRKAGVEMC